MHHFAEPVINPYIERAGYTSVCEVGAQFGDNTKRLLEQGCTHVAVVDPCIDADLEEAYAGDSRVSVHRGLSLDVLKELPGPFDCILLDGDHNWYTVYNELRVIYERGLVREGGTVFIHDVSWPYARRDLYYQPETIPEEFRHPYATKGVVRGQSELAESGGDNAHLCNAVHEGGPRNGVLTAVEDFLKDHSGQYDFFRMDVQFGLGFLFRLGERSENDAFRAYRAATLRKIRMGRLKHFVEDRAPALYRLLKAIRNALRGQG